MSTFEEARALTMVDLEEEEEEGSFDPVNISSKIMEMDLIKLHDELLIPPKFQGHGTRLADHP